MSEAPYGYLVHLVGDDGAPPIRAKYAEGTQAGLRVTYPEPVTVATTFSTSAAAQVRVSLYPWHRIQRVDTILKEATP